MKVIGRRMWMECLNLILKIMRESMALLQYATAVAESGRCPPAFAGGFQSQ
jgi:hypothetical protein